MKLCQMCRLRLKLKLRLRLKPRLRLRLRLNPKLRLMPRLSLIFIPIMQMLSYSLGRELLGNGNVHYRR
jgi:hypothetical protein